MLNLNQEEIPRNTNEPVPAPRNISNCEENSSRKEAIFYTESKANPSQPIDDSIKATYDKYKKWSSHGHYISVNSFKYSILLLSHTKYYNTFLPTSLCLEEVRNLLHDGGFAKRRSGKGFIYVQKIGCVIKETTPELMRDFVTRFIESITSNFTFNYNYVPFDIPVKAIVELYLKEGNKIFNSVWLEHLRIDDTPILKDSANEIHFPFTNCLVTVTKEGFKSQPWNDKLAFSVWEDQMINHSFQQMPDIFKSHFYTFLQNVTNQDKRRFKTMTTGIGYLLHHHFSETEGQAVVLYDENVTDINTPMGGSGKGLIVNAIKQVRKVAKVDGKLLEPTNRFRWEQVTPSTQVVWIDDVKPTFDFASLHSNLTDGWTIERKFLPQFLIKAEDNPKTVICSNSILKGGGTTNKRRQFVVELNDYYSKQLIKGDEKPIEVTHGCIFFSNSWSVEEWNSFFSVMLMCGQQFLEFGLVHFEGINIELNRFRQATDSDFADWVIKQNFQLNTRYQTKIQYFNYLLLVYGSGEGRQFGQRKFTGFLKDYGIYEGWTLTTYQSNGVSYFEFN